MCESASASKQRLTTLCQELMQRMVSNEDHAYAKID